MECLELVRCIKRVTTRQNKLNYRFYNLFKNERYRLFMIKKTLLLIFATIILSGCDIKYNLDFSEGQIKEILDFNVSDSEVEKWIDDEARGLSPGFVI